MKSPDLSLSFIRPRIGGELSNQQEAPAIYAILPIASQ
jgi:hypothetical protein